jgi:dipeptidyl aminopeptidase/acylaminoacyl peptidase
MKKYILIVTLFVIVPVSIYMWTAPRVKVTDPGGITQSESLPTPTAAIPEKPNNPYSITSLQTRPYSAGEIKNIAVIASTGSYTSYRISYTSDELLQYALLFVPKSPMPEKGYPVVLFSHGYIYPPDYSTEYSYVNPASYFAQNGFLVLKPDYRGHGKSEGKVAQRIMAQIEYAIDVRNLLEDISKIPNADETNIFLYGHSMGGEIGLRVLELYPSIRAATLWAPSIYWYPESQMYFIHKLFTDEEEFYTKQLSEIVPPEEYASVGALENIQYIQSPIIIHHAKEDNVTPYLWGQTLRDELVKAGKDATLYSYEGTSHMLGGGYSQALRRDVDFFTKHIR